MNLEDQKDDIVFILKKVLKQYNDKEHQKEDNITQFGYKDIINMMWSIADAFNKAGYRKIDENCAVITKEELKLYKEQAIREFMEKFIKDDKEFKKFCRKCSILSGSDCTRTQYTESL